MIPFSHPELSHENMISLLKDHGISITQQRLDVLKCLFRAGGHPDAEAVYEAVRQNDQYISKATVYNTLSLFETKGMLHSLEIDGTKLRYDLVAAPHGHFQCLDCGSIYNFPVPMDLIGQGLPDEFSVTRQDVYFKGICPACQDAGQRVDDKTENQTQAKKGGKQ